VVFGLAFLKFGNPIVLDRLIDAPTDFWEYVFQPWPLRWGYASLGILFIAAAAAAVKIWRNSFVDKWVLLLPSVWFAWQWVSGSQSIEPRLTQITLLHFGACLACFFLGFLVLGRMGDLRPFWGGLLVAFGLVLWMGFEQRYGGLEATRKMFYEQADWQRFPAEYIKKIESNRIFSTLVYPNALAAAILLLLPSLLLVTWHLSGRLTDISRAVLVGLLAYAALACLFWTGSKSGWLIGVVLLAVVALQRPFGRRAKLLVVTAMLVFGLAGFFIKYAPYFRRGAPSAAARFDYWRAAARTAVDNPIFGTGPGTFPVAYRKIKPPEAEMAQLAHNDYLEQASDSGFLGAATYLAFVIGSLVLLPLRRNVFGSPENFAIWLGLLGWGMQSSVEFLLYIPALGWTAFLLLGALWAEHKS
jgi:O-antigen ligase